MMYAVLFKTSRTPAAPEVYGGLDGTGRLRGQASGLETRTSVVSPAFFYLNLIL